MVVDCLRFIVCLTPSMTSLLCKSLNIIFYESGGSFGNNLNPHPVHNSKVLASAGILGYGYPTTLLNNGLKQIPHLIGMDAGPTTLRSSNIGKIKPS